MAALTNKLHVAKDGVIHEITSYTTQNEGTPLTITGGNFWKIKNNGVDAYIGLWPTSVSGGTLHSHLKIKKDGNDDNSEDEKDKNKDDEKKSEETNKNE